MCLEWGLRGVADRKASQTRASSNLDEQFGREPVQFLLDAAAQLEFINRVIAAVNSSRTIEQVFDLATAEMQSLISLIAPRSH